MKNLWQKILSWLGFIKQEPAIIVTPDPAPVVTEPIIVPIPKPEPLPPAANHYWQDSGTWNDTDKFVHL